MSVKVFYRKHAFVYHKAKLDCSFDATLIVLCVKK